MATATRKATWRSGPANGWHDDLIWYAAAINQMKLLTPAPRPSSRRRSTRRSRRASPTPGSPRWRRSPRSWADPMSLGYQSQVHASFAASSTWPKYKGKKAIWHQCAHNHWFFIPWHRAYLLEFEAVVRAHIKALGGPADTWGLPYWNYSDFAGTRHRRNRDRRNRDRRDRGGDPARNRRDRDLPRRDLLGSDRDRRDLDGSTFTSGQQTR